MKHIAYQRHFLQLLSLTFLTLTSCVSTVPQDLSALMPEGYYKFDCPIVYKDGMTRLTHQGGKAQVQLLGDFQGSFGLEFSADGKVEIKESEMGYPGQRRSFKGDGLLFEKGIARGEATSWLKSVGPFSRTHRKGPWEIRPATNQEVESFLRKQESLELRKQRAREAGLDI